MTQTHSDLAEPDQSAPLRCAATNIRIAARATGRLYDRALAPHALNTMQYAILSSLVRCGPMASLALAERLSIERTALYRALAVLERRGLVEARPGRGRERILSLSAAGRELHRSAAQDWAGTQEAFIAAFGPDWQRLLSLLARARAVADDLPPPAPAAVETPA